MLRRMRVISAGALVTVLCSGALVAGPASAGEVVAPSLVVTPSAGLRDGQTVAAKGAGFQPEVTESGVTRPGQATVALCSSQVLNGILNMADLCSAQTSPIVPVDASGRFNTEAPAPRTSVNIFGQPIDCTTGPDACVWLAFQFVGFAGPLPIPTVVYAFAPVSFRAQTFADCQGTRWSTFTDGRGRHFRSALGCKVYVFVSWLIAHHRVQAIP